MALSRAFGQVIRELRKKKGLTQEQLGFDADLRRTFVSVLELGQQQPTLQTIFKLSQALEVDPSELIKLVENHLKVTN